MADDIWPDKDFMTKAKWKEELFMEMDKQLEAEKANIEELTKQAKDNPKRFMEKVKDTLQRTSKTEFRLYRKEYNQANGRNALTYDMQGFKVYLRSKAATMGYYEAMDRAGLDEEQLENIIRDVTDQKYPAQTEAPVMVNAPQERIVLRDLITQKLFSNELTADEYISLQVGTSESGNPINTLVNVEADKLGNVKISTPIKLGKYTPATEDVMNAITSLYVLGENHYITYPMIERALTGKQRVRISQKRMNELDDMVSLLMGSNVHIIASEEAENLGVASEWVYDGRLLDASRIKKKNINGVQMACIKISAEPILYTYASLKNHINRYPLEILDAGLPSTNENNVITNYIAKRVSSIPFMSNTILLETLYEQVSKVTSLGTSSGAIKKKKKEIRDKAETVLNHFKKTKFIKGYSLTKKGRTFHSIVVRK